MPAPSTPCHSPRRLSTPDPEGWIIYLAHQQPRRLVVFVHGFHGGPLGTWQEFPQSNSAWWKESDMLFVAYDSATLTIAGVAELIRDELPKFYPGIRHDLLVSGNVRLREDGDLAYEELVLVGHSLGGMIVRRALCDAAQEWLNGPHPSIPQPAILQARTKLFSPASAGLRLAGWYGMLRATTPWGVVNMVLRRSPAFTDLQQDSPILTDTRQVTEALVRHYGSMMDALVAQIAWASPDNLVLDIPYSTDKPVRHVPGTTHRSVCKPTAGYPYPRTVVEARW